MSEVDFPATEELRPALRFDARVTISSDELRIEVDDTLLRVTGLPGADFQRFVVAADGDQTLGHMAHTLGLSLQQLNVLCRRLENEGVLRLLSDIAEDITSPDDLVTACRSLFPTWKRRLFSHPLWRSLCDGSAPHNVFVGWLLESYHFIEGVTARLPTAIAFCRDPNVRRHFVQHFAEEYDHHHFFVRSLDAIGIAPEQLRNYTPLPSTSAILTHMRDCGRRDPLSYASCSGFLESTGADRRDAHEFFAQLRQNFDPANNGVVDPLAEHSTLDEGYNHTGFLEKICADLGSISRCRADAALQAVYTLLETLELWSTDIDRHYRTAAIPPSGVRRYRASMRL
jgi:pyrroloquinoline quinone (PQQ) biosynthesis protein C